MKLKTLLTLFSLAMIHFASAQHLVAPLSESVVYSKGLNQVDTYRIPAVIQAKNGAILAFSEARFDSSKDTGNIDLVLRRSLDGGKTWGDVITVWNDANHVCGNPAPVVDFKTGRIIMLMTWNHGSDPESAIQNRTSKDTRRVYVTFSDDHGLTWTTPREITSQVKRSAWAWYATGPCHAIQLQKGKHKGRLVVSANHSIFKEGQYLGSASHILYSDDLGQTWHIGAGAQDELFGGNESSVVELKNGDVMINMRNARWEGRDQNGLSRMIGISHDGGESISKEDIYFDRMLIEPICQGSVINYTKHHKLSETILFSNPNCTSKRRNMTVKISRDHGQSWRVYYQQSNRKAAYSDLVVLDDHRIGLLYETGDKSSNDEIRFVVLPQVD